MFRPTFRGEAIPFVRSVVCGFDAESRPGVTVVLLPRSKRKYASGQRQRLALLIALMRDAGATVDESSARTSYYVLTRLHASDGAGGTMGGRSCRTFGRAEIVSRREFAEIPLVDRCTFCTRRIRGAAKV